jgi:hypothetical protein
VVERLSLLVPIRRSPIFRAPIFSRGPDFRARAFEGDFRV